MNTLFGKPETPELRENFNTACWDRQDAHLCGMFSLAKVIEEAIEGVRPTAGRLIFLNPNLIIKL